MNNKYKLVFSRISSTVSYFGGIFRQFFKPPQRAIQRLSGELLPFCLLGIVQIRYLEEKNYNHLHEMSCGGKRPDFCQISHTCAESIHSSF